MIATIKRLPTPKTHTLGEMELKDGSGKVIFRCKTLELPWLNNEVQKSCIPPGSYDVVPRTSQKFGKHFHVLNVPGRSYILIHPANYKRDLLGCIGVGASFADLDKDGLTDITSSKATLNKLLNIAPMGFKLIIE